MLGTIVYTGFSAGIATLLGLGFFGSAYDNASRFGRGAARLRATEAEATLLERELEQRKAA